MVFEIDFVANEEDGHLVGSLDSRDLFFHRLYVLERLVVRYTVRNDESLTVLDVKGFPIHSSWYIVWPKGKQLSPIAEVFLQHILSHADELSA